MALLLSLPPLPTGYDESEQPGLSLGVLPGDDDEALVVVTTLLPAAAEDAADEDAGAGTKKKKKKSKTELQAQLAERDPYKLLELDDLRWRASADDIKKAYRKMVLKHHPDKQQGAAAAEAAAKAAEKAAAGGEGKEERKSAAEEEEGDEMFKAITEAFELLSDSKRRRDFDSLDDFDDSIPPSSFKGSAEEFLAAFGPVFERNSRWSERPNAPLLGGTDTPFEDVAAFYNFWFDFRSWRDFADADEYDPADAGYREERRWMEKQNEKLRSKKRKVEKSRISKLVELAYAHDPRVAAYKAGLKEAKARGKAERAARLAADKEAEAAAEAERAAAAEAEAERKAAEAKAAKALRKARGRLRGLVKEHALTEPGGADVLCERLGTDALDALCAEAEAALAGAGAKAGASALVCAAVERERGAAAAEEAAAAAAAAERQAAIAAKAAAEAAKAPWTEQELTLLVKGANKFPGGVPDRWDRLAEFINHFADPCHNRSPDEVSNKVRERRRELEQKKAAGVPAPKAAGVPAPKPPAPSARPTTAPPAAPSGAAATATPATPVAAPAAPAAPVAAAGGAAAEESPWSTSQQSALEAALKAVPASVGAERWDRIAEKVVGKTRAECVARYKQIVAALKAKKAAAAAAASG